MSKRIFRQSILLSMSVVAVAATRVGDAVAQGKRTPRQQYEALMKDFDAKREDLVKDQQRLRQQMAKAKTNAERTRLSREFSNLFRNSPVTRFTPRFVRFAKANKKSESGLEAMAWVIRSNPRDKNIPDFMKTILKHHATSKTVSVVLPYMQRALKKIPVDFLRKIIDENQSQQAKATASVFLAGQLKQDAQTQGDLKQYRESITLFEKTSKKFATLGSPRGGTIFEFCRDELAEMNGPRALGKVVPEIVGEDLDGNKFKLSETRGQVVLLDFWADFQPQCREMYAQKNKLVKQFAGKPFALVGINCDRSLQKLKQTVKKKNIAWRSYWSGGTRSPIVKAWKISQWPTIYLIDADGVIRYKNLKGKALDAAIEKLLSEAAKTSTNE